jgi:hypothetical protein
MLQTRQLDLKLAFVAARASREDIEYEFGPVDDGQFPLPSEIALLHCGELSVKDNGVDRLSLDLSLDLLRLARPDEQGWVLTRTAHLDSPDRLEAGRQGKTHQLVGGGRIQSRSTQRDRNQQAALLRGLGRCAQLSVLS